MLTLPQTPSLRLDGKRALVTGASRGIGFEFARQYVQEGWRVLATARDDQGCAKLQAIGAEAFKLDVAQPSSVSGLSWRLDGERIDLALYVAGVMDRNSPKTPPTQEVFDELMHANVLGAMQALPQVAPWVAEANGTFAFISSRMASLELTDSGRAALYKVSKAALNMMVVALALELQPKGFKVVALSPGQVDTQGYAARGMVVPGTVPVEQSVAGLRNVIDRLTREQSGSFIRYSGDVQPW